MPRRRHAPKDARQERPATPYQADGTLDPREWEAARGAARHLAELVLPREPWFVEARPIEVHAQGVELDVVVRWVSSEVYAKVPASVDGYVVNVVLEGKTFEIHTLH